MILLKVVDILFKNLSNVQYISLPLPYALTLNYNKAYTKYLKIEIKKHGKLICNIVTYKVL